MESIIVAVITSVFTLIGVVITSKANANKISKDMEIKLTVHQAVTDEKISELTREVREHNNFAKRMPVVENDIANIKDKIDYFHRGQ